MTNVIQTLVTSDNMWGHVLTMPYGATGTDPKGKATYYMDLSINFVRPDGWSLHRDPPREYQLKWPSVRLVTRRAKEVFGECFSYSSPGEGSTIITSSRYSATSILIPSGTNVRKRNEFLGFFAGEMHITEHTRTQI